MVNRKSTQVTIPATDVHRNFAELVRRAFSGREHFIVEKDGLPVVAILSVAEYEALINEREQQQDKETKRQQFHQLARKFGEAVQEASISESDLDAIVEETRQQMHEEQRGSEPAK
ncbi:MAG: type II toxin-antitoxin system Phd/YefM family antitoxin [Burkholderiales bacterium]|nr:type II toxin-antitoxin system Phd/YefM family antitoxin [Anaerolineae bacterium]